MSYNDSNNDNRASEKLSPEQLKYQHRCRQCAKRGKLHATDWLDGIRPLGNNGPVEVMFKNTRNGFYANPDGIPLKIGDIVAVEAQPGHDIGRVSMTGPLVRAQMSKHNVTDDTQLKRVFRIATTADLEKFEQARALEEDTMIRSRKIAEELGLAMKIGDVEYQGDGGKAIFYYIADERVDFRKLIRVLADNFHVKIEMKQIGARQEAGRIGGIGPCGRPLCCSSWMTHFNSVGTGSARLQDLSMNPQKLAGQCAKLKCCINFEIDAYSEARRKLPLKEVTLETQDASYYYFKADILAGTVTYSTDKNIAANLVTIPAKRAQEIIELNKQGIRAESLEENPEQQKSSYVDLAEQESLTRFDKSKKKKKKKNGSSRPADNKEGNDNKKVADSKNESGKTQEHADSSEQKHNDSKQYRQRRFQRRREGEKGGRK